jgi:hypothetical protein
MSTPPKWRNFPDVDILLWFALAENGDLLVALKHDDGRTEVENVMRRDPRRAPPRNAQKGYWSCKTAED